MKLLRTEHGQGEYYILQNTQLRKKSITQKILSLPLRLVQYLIKAPLAYFILNPLFMKYEEAKTILKKKTKYPDPMIKEEDDIVVLNVISMKGKIQRILSTWVGRLFFLLERFPMIGYLFKNRFQFHYQFNPKHLNALFANVSRLLKPNQFGVKSWTCEQIQFKGLEYLKPDERAYLFKKLQEEHGYDFKKNLEKYNFFTLQSPTGEKLDSVEVRGPTVMQQNIANRTFIVYCLPRSHHYQDWITQYRYFANELNTTVIGFNYRGIGISTGVMLDPVDLRNDAIAQVQRLIAMGANPNNIAMMGECLGANLATQAIEQLQKEGHAIKLFSARSFRSLPSLLLGTIAPEKDAATLHPKTWFQKFSALLIKLILLPIIRFMHWDISSEKAFLSIPPQNRDFFTVRSQKDPITHKRFKDDTVINHREASIYSLVKEQQKKIREKQKIGISITKEERDWLNDNLKGHQVFVSPGLRPNDANTTDGHFVHFRYLAQTHPAREGLSTDAREYALGFFRRVGISTDNEFTNAHKKLNEL